MKNLITIISFVIFSMNINAQNVYDISREYLSGTYLLDMQGKLKPGNFVKVGESLLRTKFSDSVRYEMVIATIHDKEVKIQKRIFTGKPPVVIITNEENKKIKFIVLIGYMIQ